MKMGKRAMLVIPAAAGLLLAAGVGPASASNSSHANCVGQNAVYLNQIAKDFYPGLGGRVQTAWSAPQGYSASNDFCL